MRENVNFVCVCVTTSAKKGICVRLGVVACEGKTGRESW